jgi:hypothetical protein
VGREDIIAEGDTAYELFGDGEAGLEGSVFPLFTRIQAWNMQRGAPDSWRKPHGPKFPFWDYGQWSLPVFCTEHVELTRAMRHGDGRSSLGEPPTKIPFDWCLEAQIRHGV